MREGAERCLLCTSKIVGLVLSAWLSWVGGRWGHRNQQCEQQPPKLWGELMLH